MTATYSKKGRSLSKQYSHEGEEDAGRKNSQGHASLPVGSKATVKAPHKPAAKSKTHHSSNKLRLITYVSPDVPVALFELLRDYLEEVTGHEAYLIYETRWKGPASDRKDPFTTDDVDIAFMDSAAYSLLKQHKNTFVELCQAAPLHSNPNAAGRPVHFSEIIVHKNNRDRFNNFDALKGCRWAYNSDDSFSGNLAVLEQLRKHGTNASFFGECIQSGSHLKSIQMILDGRAEAAAVDSITLAGFFAERPELTDCFHVVKSLGPHPVYALVFNSRLPAELKHQITEALLSLSKTPGWSQRFERWRLLGYAKVDESFFDREDVVVERVRGLSIAPAYY